LRAIGSTLGASRRAAGLGPLYVGSIKPTVGHTEGCSGLAGVFKAVVCLEKGMLVPTYGVEHVNPQLKLEEWNLILPQQVMEWPSEGQRRVSINSFGFGGANAHVILDDAHHYLAKRGLMGKHNTIVLPDDDSGISVGSSTPSCNETTKQLFIFSTKDQAGIKRISATYADWLGQEPTSSEADAGFFRNLAYTLGSRRSALDFRSYAVASTVSELQEQLTKGLLKLPRSSRQDGSLVFVFTGQGAQWPGMGRQLIGNAVFRESMEKSQRYLEDLGCSWNAIDELQKTEDSQIHLPEYSQTLCTVLQVALVDLLHQWGVTPKAVVGHSSGEIAAAYAASLITHTDAVKIAYVRGLSSAAVTREGAMLAVGLSEEEAREHLSEVTTGSAVVACVNSPSSVTLSGDVDSIDKLESLISGTGKFARKLQVKTAYHSPHMREVSQGYLKRIGAVAHPKQDDHKTLMFSSLTGRLVESSKELDAHYWVSNMQAPVQFNAAVTALLTHRVNPAKKAPMRWGGFVEIGPHAALQGPVQQIISFNANKAAKEAPYLSTLLRNKDAVETSLAAAGQLWAAGHALDLRAVNGITARDSKALTNLPPYPWNHSNGFWHESYTMRSNRFPTGPRTDLLGVAEDMQNKAEPRWRNHLRITENPWIEDHQITGTILYPAAGMLIMALEGVLQMATDPSTVQGFRFRDVGFERGLVVPSGDEAAVETRLSLLPHGSLPGQFQFTIYSTTSGNSWTKHCSGIIALELAQSMLSEIEDSSADDADWERRTAFYQQLRKNGEPVDVEEFYEHLEKVGMEYGPLFRNVVELSTVPQMGAATADVVLPDTASSMPAGFEFPHVMHPATMDSIFHMLLGALNHGRPVAEAAVPYRIDDMFVAADQPHGAGSVFKGYGELVSTGDGGHELVGDLIVSDEAWSGPKLTVKGFALRQVTSTQANAGYGQVKKCAQLNWKEDIDFIQHDTDLLKLGDSGIEGKGLLSAWLDRLTHKKAVSEVLVLVDHAPSREVIHILADISARVGKQPGVEKISIAASSPVVLESIRSLVPSLNITVLQWDIHRDEELPSGSRIFDLILVVDVPFESSELSTKLRGLLSPEGHIAIQQTKGNHDNLTRNLQDTGFRNVITTGDIHIASVSSPPSIVLPQEVYFLMPSEPTKENTILVSALTTTLISLNIDAHEIRLSDASNLAGKHVISLLECSTPAIYSWTAPDFNAFKTMISVAGHVFWLTRGDVLGAWGSDGNGASFAPAQGLLRVLRNEYPLVKLPHLDVSPMLDLFDFNRLIIDVWKRSLIPNAEMEFAVDMNGIVHVPRAIGDDIFDEELERGATAAGGGRAKPIRSKLNENGVPLMSGEVINGSDFLWEEDSSTKETLGSHEVEIKVETVAFEAPDGHQQQSPLRNKAVGTVSRCGPQVKSIALGQRVMVLCPRGALRTHVRQNETLVAQLPGNIESEEAVTIAGVFVAAQYALLEIARLQRGQSVLVHSAASAYGQAAIQVAKFIGSDVFALVSTGAEKQLLMDRYQISSARIYDSALTTFVTAIKQITNNYGINVILSSRPCPAVQLSGQILADFGHFIGLGRSDIDLKLPAGRRNAVIAGVNVEQLQRVKPDTVSRLFRRTFDLFARSGNLKPLAPSRSFSISDTSRALASLHDDPYTPVAVSLNDANASVLMIPAPPPKLALDPHGTYVLAGGLGALGLDIARMMATHGAGHLVFLSRSGGSTKHAPALESLRALGARVDAYSCDVSHTRSVVDIFEQLHESGCQVRGVLQAAMVLEDAIFDNMTHDQWQRAFTPKTRGSRNLLDQLALHKSEDTKPFFLLLSSITGVIGNTAQANYAAGNTFEDALAQHALAHRSVAATSIDVGLVADSSHFTADGEFGNLDAYLHRYSHGWRGLRTSLEELRIVLVALMRRAQNSEPAPAQLILGLGNELVRRSGAADFQHDRKFELRVSRLEQNASDGGEAGSSESLAEKLAKAISLEEAAAAVEADIKAQVAAAIGVAVNEVDAQRPLFDFGGEYLTRAPSPHCDN
jgi:acyl transferase domain-containing protein/NADPH:quinone reductase-like Zn-dependent oxidoreductase/NAD(P)-dependent dehydrogenase (short-subunit alcohol dehydrogenase family)